MLLFSVMFFQRRSGIGDVAVLIFRWLPYDASWGCICCVVWDSQSNHSSAGNDSVSFGISKIRY